MISGQEIFPDPTGEEISHRIRRASQSAAVLSLVAVTGLVLAYLWWGRFHYYHSIYAFLTYLGVSAIVVANHLYFGDTRQSMGFRIDNLEPALRWYGGFSVLVIAAAFLATGWEVSWVAIRGDELIGYALWAGLQQHVLQNFLRARSVDLSPLAIRSRPWCQALFGSCLAAGLFAIVHLPNYALAGVALLGGVILCLSFTRIPSFPGVWLSHALLGITVLLPLKQGPLHQMQVGFPGYRYEAFGDGVQVAAGYDASGVPFVVATPGPARNARPQLRLFDFTGELQKEWNAFEEVNFSCRISVGELGLAPGSEIVATPGPGAQNPPWIRIFDTNGQLLRELRVEAFPKGYGMWASVACGRIYTSPGPGPGHGQEVTEMGLDGSMRNWKFHDLPFVNGLKSTRVCDSDRDMLLLWGSEISINPASVYSFDLRGQGKTKLETIPTTYGANLATVRNGVGAWGVAVAPGPLVGYSPWIQVMGLDGEPWSQFVAWESSGPCGANLAAVDLDGDGRDELVVGEGHCSGQSSRVGIYDLEGRLRQLWTAYP